MVVEALDHEIGRLLGALDEIARERTYVVVVVGDNAEMDEFRPEGNWFGDRRGKGDVYEAGVRVPLLVRGPDLARGVAHDALVADVDLFPTILDLARVPPDHPSRAGIDGQSFAGVLYDPLGPGARRVVLSEQFAPNGTSHPDTARSMVADCRYKLVTDLQGRRELYDLRASWPEGVDLLRTGRPGARDVADDLAREEERMRR